MKRIHEVLAVAFGSILILFLFVANLSLLAYTPVNQNQYDTVDELEKQGIVVQPDNKFEFKLNDTQDGDTLFWNWSVQPISDKLIFEVYIGDQLLVRIDSARSDEGFPLSSGKDYTFIWKNENNNSVQLKVNSFDILSDPLSGIMEPIMLILAGVLVILAFVLTFRNRHKMENEIALLPNLFPLLFVFASYTDFIIALVMFFILFLISFVLFDIFKIDIKTIRGKIIIPIYILVSLYIIYAIFGWNFLHDPIQTSIGFQNQTYIYNNYFKEFIQTPVTYLLYGMFFLSIPITFLSTRIITRELIGSYLLKKELKNRSVDTKKTNMVQNGKISGVKQPRKK